MEAITLTLNGQAISARAGQTILEVARERGVDIPTLCHHDLLRSIGACRLCQVEDEKRGVVVPACVTEIQPEMVISTHSERVVNNRRNILRLLMAAHPESCLVCEKGNMCQLRSLAAQHGLGSHGLDRMPYHPGTVDLNPNLVRDLSKCILCAKCIRADQEVVVEGVIDYNKRGFDAHPATLFMDSLENAECTFCGTCLSVCPVGAIQEKNRPRLDHGGAATESVCSLCACGCAIEVEHSAGTFRGVSPTGKPDSPNGISLCVKGHFGHDYLVSPERLTGPLVKGEEGFEPLAWDAALDLAAEKLGGLAQGNGGSGLGFMGGSRSTLEEIWLLTRLAREAGAEANLAGQAALAGAAAAGEPFSELASADVIIVAGVDPTISAPVLGYHLKRAVRLHGARLIVIHALPGKLTAMADHLLQPQPGGEGVVLAALAGQGEGGGVDASSLAEAARALAGAKRIRIIYPPGPGAGLDGPARLVAESAGAGLVPVLTDCNTRGVQEFLPDVVEPLALLADRERRIQGLYILAEDPLGRAADPAAMTRALENLEFVVVQDQFLTETARLADLVLPAAALAEKSGAVINLEGRLQRFDQALIPPGDFPPEWKVLAGLSARLGREWDYVTAEDVWKEVRTARPDNGLSGAGLKVNVFLPFVEPGPAADFTPPPIPAVPVDDQYSHTLVCGPCLEHLGSGSRTGRSLRLGELAGGGWFGLSTGDMAALGLEPGQTVRVVSEAGELEGPARADDRLAPGVIFAPNSFPGWRPAALGPGPCRVKLYRPEP